MYEIIGELEPVQNGLLTVYDSNGNITITGSILNGMSNGKFNSYENTKLVYTCNYIEDELDGISQWFYPNGNLEKITNFIKGKKDGESFTYDSLGTLIKYRYNSQYLNYTMFELKYGEVLEYSGTPFIEIIPDQDYLNDSISVEIGDTISFDFVVPTPPKCKFIFEVYTIINGDISNVLDQDSQSRNEYHLEYVIPEKVDLSIKLLGVFCDGKEYEFIVPIKING